MNKPINNPFILGLQARNLTVEIHHHSAYQIVLSNGTLSNTKKHISMPKKVDILGRLS